MAIALYTIFPCGIVILPLWRLHGTRASSNDRSPWLLNKDRKRRHAYVGQLGVPEAIVASSGNLRCQKSRDVF